MKKITKVLMSGLFLFVLFFNASLVADNTSDRSDLTLSKLIPEVQAKEEPIDGGHIGEVTITCSGKGWGRCYTMQAGFCSYDMYNDSNFSASCVFMGTEGYYCSIILVKLCNFIFNPGGWF